MPEDICIGGYPDASYSDFILNTSVYFISTDKNADGDVTETPEGTEMCRVEEKPFTIRTENGNLLQLQTMVYLNATAYRIEKGWLYRLRMRLTASFAV